MNSYTNYAELIKPDWAPPAYLFGPVWSVLYTIIFISFGYVFYKVWKGEVPRYVAVPFALNLLFNFLFTPIQFGLQNNFLATLDILAVLLTLVWSLLVIYRYYPMVMWVNIPYFLWVSFATVLQVTITYMNW